MFPFLHFRQNRMGHKKREITSVIFLCLKLALRRALPSAVRLDDRAAPTRFRRHNRNQSKSDIFDGHLLDWQSTFQVPKI